MIRISRIWCMFIWMRSSIRIFIREKRFSVRKAGTIIWNSRKDLWNIMVLYTMRWRGHFLLRMRFWSVRSWTTFFLIPLMAVNQAVIRKIFRILPMRTSWISTKPIIIRPTAIFISMEIWIWRRSLTSLMSIICLILNTWMWILWSGSRGHLTNAGMWRWSIPSQRMREKRIIPIFLIIWSPEMPGTARWQWHLKSLTMLF